MTKEHYYLYGEDSRDKVFYVIYIGKNYHYSRLKNHMKSLEGVFVSEKDLRKEQEIHLLPSSIPSCRKDEMKDFEQKYQGKFIPFEK